MKGATQCAQRLKSLFSTLRTKLGKPNLPSSGDPISQMLLGILSRDVPEPRAREALEKLRVMVVDYNELRVIPPLELAQEIGLDYPEARLKCEDISRALNQIFARRHEVTLDHVQALNRKEAREALNQVDGLEPYTAARVQLLGLQQHAIPLDSAMLAYARQEEVVNPKCPLDEASAFLERRISESDALEFFALFRQQAWSEFGDAVAAGEVERIRSVPPDRTTRNMLQALSSTADRPVLQEDPVEDHAVEDGAAAETGSSSATAAGSARGKAAGKSSRSAKARKADKKKPKAAAKGSGAKRRTSGKKAAATTKGAKAKATKRGAAKGPRATTKKKTTRKTASKPA